jgi:choline dehydrogenase
MSAGIRYLLLRDGPLSVSLNQAGGFIRTDPGRTRPNMQLYFQAFSTVIPRPGERPILNPDPWPGFSIGWSNCRPKSRGEIMIRSADPFEAPRITPNALSHEDDVAEMLATGKLIRQMAAAKPMADHIEAELLPGPEITDDEAMIDDIRRRSGTVYHPVSTCRMGPDAAHAVVDSRLRVHGIAGAAGGRLLGISQHHGRKHQCRGHRHRMACCGAGASGRRLRPAVPPVCKRRNDLGGHCCSDHLGPLVGDLAADRADQF